MEKRLLWHGGKCLCKDGSIHSEGGRDSANCSRHLNGFERHVKESVLYPLHLCRQAGMGGRWLTACFRNTPPVARMAKEREYCCRQGQPRIGVRAGEQHQPQEVKQTRQSLRGEEVPGVGGKSIPVPAWNLSR